MTSFNILHCDYRKILFGFKSIYQVNIFPVEDPSLLVCDAVTGPVFPTVWRGFCSLFLMGKQSKKMKALQTFTMSETTGSTLHCHIQEDSNL
jgi:hypothetical protein